MIETAEAKRFIAEMPWPEGTRPCLVTDHGQLEDGRHAFTARLYRLEKRFLGRDVLGRGPTPEGALRAALALWIQSHTPAPAELVARLPRLVN